MTEQKDDLDIDFDAILKDFDKLEELTKPTIQPLGISPAFKKEDNNWYAKDIAFMTDEEFVLFVLQVFPFTTEEELKTRKLSDRSIRNIIYNEIEAFHKVSLFPVPPDITAKF